MKASVPSSVGVTWKLENLQYLTYTKDVSGGFAMAFHPFTGKPHLPMELEGRNKKRTRDMIKPAWILFYSRRNPLFLGDHVY
jgi:hypothetical protein